MNNLLVVGLCAIVLSVCGTFSVQANQLGGKDVRRCADGPVAWCSSIPAAKACHAVKFCIQTTWEKQTTAVDDDSICGICKKMVTEARDQLRSNETMEEIKEVFEGSCKVLIPLKVVREECIKIADNFMPELIEMLSSQMNPDQVCSVAGLCNSMYIDDAVRAYYKAALEDDLTEEEFEKVTPSVTTAATEIVASKPKYLLTCGNCQQLGSLLTNKFHATHRDTILDNILQYCGQMGSFSDACANIAISYFNYVYEVLQEGLSSSAICHLSASCVGLYHQHPEDPKEEAPIDLTKVEGDDIPCELCEQLVKHLRDVLVANTTEEEFKQVLEGICKQTHNFSSECLSIVDQYYDVIYHTLVDNLDANGACFMIGVCPKGAQNAHLEGEVRPLVVNPAPAKKQVSLPKKLGANEPKFTQEELMSMQLPIDHLMGAPNALMLVNNGELCTMCEYLLHFIQETLATPATEDDIKHTVNHICDKLAPSLRGHCHDFIDMYGDAVIALLIQGLNPREICPSIKMCPPNTELQQDVEVLSPTTISSDESDKPTCPLCVFAVQSVKDKLKDNHNKKDIIRELSNLCGSLPTKLQAECKDFVNTYSGELIDKLISDFTAQEICVSLKLCPTNNTYLSDLGISVEEDKSSEEVADSSEVDKNESSAPNCLLCEEVVKVVEKRMGKHPTKESIKKALEQSCTKLRKPLQNKCEVFIKIYGDVLAELIVKETNPKMLCAELGFCLWNEHEDLEVDEALKYHVIATPNSEYSEMTVDSLIGQDDINVDEPPTCVLCEFIMAKLEAEMQNKKTQDEIKKTVEHICDVMPKTVRKNCNKFIEQYANTIIMLIGTVPPKAICTNMQLCISHLDAVITDSVIECGVCHGASQALLPYFKQRVDVADITGEEMVTVACENVPAKYNQICSEMISVYGQSLLHLSQSKDFNEEHMCAEIGKCYNNEKSGRAFAKLTA